MPPLLIELLNSFDDSQFKALDKFIQSPYFNTNKAVSVLYGLLKKHIIQKRVLDDKYLVLIYGQIFPNDSKENTSLSAKQKRVFDATMAKLMALVKRFLAVEALEENIVYRNILLHDKLLTKNQLRITEINIKRARKLLGKEVSKDQYYYFHKYHLEQNALNLSYRRGMILQYDNLPGLLEAMDMHYLIERLDLQLTTITMLGASNLKDDHLPLDAISSLLEVKQYATHPLIRIYQKILEMLKNNDATKQQAVYQQLLQLLDEFEAHLSKDKLSAFYKTAIIFCAQRIRAGEVAYYKETFHLYKVMETKGLLVDNGFIPVGLVKNIIIISCHVGEFDWAREMLDTYKPSIRKPVRESVYHFNMGVIAFYEKNYKQAISHFIRVNKINVNYDINCRVLILKSYYELDDDYDERTMQQFRSTKRFIHDNKSLKNNNKQGWENFVSAAANLYKVRHRYGKITTERVQQQIDKFKSINDKRWLLEKMRELK